MGIVQLNMIYQELISSARDNNVTRRSVMTYEISDFFIVYKHSQTLKKQLGKQPQLHLTSTS